MGSNSCETNLKKLNVVFHGTFLFVVRPHDVEVLIPKVSMHAYYAGSWKAGGLHALEQGSTYTLDLHENVPPPAYPPAEFEENKNLFFDERPRADDPTLRRLILPRRPNHIHTLQCVTLEKKNFVHRSDDSSVEIPPKVVGLIHVLTFDLYGSEPPSIDRLPKWEPLPGIDDSIANLHVFADPPSLMTAMRNGQMSSESPALRHPTEAFNALIKLTSAPAFARGLRSSSHSASLKFQFPAGEIPLVEPSGHEVVQKLGLRQIELVTLALSNLLPRDAHKMGPAAMTDADTGCRPTLNCMSGTYPPT
ncbi:MAG: hypothetical protein ABSH32_13700 [Bryobacteraceae bacterium]|jgi:hypothetical protein